MILALYCVIFTLVICSVTSSTLYYNCYILFLQGLFRNFDEAFLPLFRKHLENLVTDTSHDKREYSHRLAAEIMSGIIRGSKHWDYDRVSDGIVV